MPRALAPTSGRRLRPRAASGLPALLSSALACGDDPILLAEVLGTAWPASSAAGSAGGAPLPAEPEPAPSADAGSVGALPEGVAPGDVPEEADEVAAG